MATGASRDLRVFIAALKDVSATAPATMRRELRSAAGVVATEARKISEQHSTSIPPTIRTSVQPSRGRAAVLAGGKGVTRGLARRMFAAPYGTEASERAYAAMQREQAGNVLAGLYEYGNKGSRPSDYGTFRHPVLGDMEVWVNQQRWAFLHPAAEHKGPELEAQMVAVIERWVRVLAGYRAGQL